MPIRVDRMTALMLLVVPIVLSNLSIRTVFTICVHLITCTDHRVVFTTIT